MKFALIEPDGRIATIVDGDSKFDVSEPLKWVVCDDGIDPNTWEFNGVAVVPKTSDLAKQRRMVLSWLDKRRDFELEAPVTLGNRTWDASKAGQTKIDRLIKRNVKGKPMPAKLRDVNGKKSPLTPELLDQIDQAFDDYSDTVWEKYGTLHDAALAATTLEELLNVRW
jgi:hypothetical protein